MRLVDNVRTIGVLIGVSRLWDEQSTLRLPTSVS